MKLKPFQLEGAEFLAQRKRALLADDMRIGKTIQAVEACRLVGATSVTVVCPAIARPVWRWHFKEFAPHVKLDLLSYDEARKRKLWPRADVLIIDECHFTKSPEAQRSQAVWGKPTKHRPNGGAAWNADYIWCLSGTPAPNHVGELWPMLRCFGATGMTYRDFTDYFCRKDGLGKILGTDPKHVPELRAIMKPFTLRRTKSDVGLDLPVIEPLPVEPSLDFLRMVYPVNADERYDRARRELAALADTLAKLPEDEQLAYLADNTEHYAALRRLTALLKAPYISELIQFEIENNMVDKLVVFGYSRDALRLIYRELHLREPKIRAELVYGGTPQNKKEAAVKAFQRPSKKGGARVFLGNIITAGVAIDLSAAKEGIMLEQDWVPGNNQQAMDRMGGWNQKGDVRVRSAFLAGSVDEQIAGTIHRKINELAEVFN